MESAAATCLGQGAKKGGVSKGGPRRVWGAKFCAFSSSPATIFFLSSPLGCFLVEFWWCLKRQKPSNVHVWRAQTSTYQGPGLQKNTTKIQRKDLQEREERKKNVAGEGKKRNFARSGGGGPVEGRGPREGGLGDHPNLGRTHENLDTLQHNSRTTHNTQNKSGSDICQQVGVWGRWGASGGGWRQSGSTLDWPNSVLAKLGQTLKTPTLAKVGLAKVGHDRCNSRGSVCCKAVAHRLFSGRELVPSSQLRSRGDVLPRQFV